MFSSLPLPMNSRSAIWPSLVAMTTSRRSSSAASGSIGASSSSSGRAKEFRSRGARVSRVSSATALRRSFMASSQPRRLAKRVRNAVSSGRVSICRRDWKRILRGPVSSTYRIIAMAAKPPVVTPLLSRLPHTGPRSGRPKRPNWKAAPIQKQTPATTTFCRLGSVWMTVRAPSTNRVPVTTTR